MEGYNMSETKLNNYVKCEECLFGDICKYKSDMINLSDTINNSIDGSSLPNISRVVLDCSFYKGLDYYNTTKNYN